MTEIKTTLEDFTEIIAVAMMDHGPDGHCDGADKIAEIALSWLVKHTSSPSEAGLREALQRTVAEMNEDMPLANDVKSEWHNGYQTGKRRYLARLLALLSAPAPSGELPPSLPVQSKEERT